MHIKRADVVNPTKIPLPAYLMLVPKRHLESSYVRLGKLESRLLRHKLMGMTVDRPIYVTGLARAGTTITLELMSQHADAATHRYRDMSQPHLPYFWNRVLGPMHRLLLPYLKPAERLHKDGIFVTPDSPEAVEESIWKYFFKFSHDEGRSAVLDARASNPDFERYYTDHINKLLLATGRARYLTKANYNVTRLGYLARLFPGARFIVLVRHPAAHLASWLKQDELLSRLRAHDPRWQMAAEMAGHHEFGPRRMFINTGDTDQVRAIRQAWDRGETARAFGMYWASIYGYVGDLIAGDPHMHEATMIVRYEDLCAEPGKTIDNMLAHAALDPVGLGQARYQYQERIKTPSYYSATLDQAEYRAIEETTGEVAASLGYAAASTSL